MAKARFLAGVLLLGLTLGCKSQTVPSAPPDPTLTRRIEILVRSQFDLPAEVTITMGARKPSQFTGYETLPITIQHDGKSSEFEFLISDDSTKLVHMDSMDLTKDPANAIPIAGRPIRGNPNAKVTIVNFDDLECPYCGRMHQQLFPETMNRYKDLVRIVYKDDPLVDIHPWAMHASVDANCLAAQNDAAYWAYVDYLHSHGDEVNGEQRDLPRSFATLDRIARQEGTLNRLNGPGLDACLAKQDETQMRESMKLALSMGIEGTPVVFVNGEKLNGAVPVEQVWIAVDRALRSVGEEPPAPPAPAAPVPMPHAAPAAAAAPVTVPQGPAR